jgi:dihydroorotase
MAKGLTFEQVIERTTLNAAKALNRPDLGSLEEGGVADIAVFEVDQKKRVRCVMTIRNGRVVWDTEGLSLTDWKDAGPYSNFK